MPLEHLQIELRRNEDLVFGGKATTITFFTDISAKHASLQEDLSDPHLKQLIFPLKEEVNMQPFDELVPLKEGCKLKTDEEMNYCIENINTEWALSTLELLTAIYGKTRVIRIFTHTPFCFKYVIECKTLLKPELASKINLSVLNIKNLDRLYTILNNHVLWLELMSTESARKDDYSEIIYIGYYVGLNKLLDYINPKDAKA